MAEAMTVFLACMTVLAIAIIHRRRQVVAAQNDIYVKAYGSLAQREWARKRYGLK